jgi:lipid II:glycine glycyltransferase (peptidoglycan interpeptide bridge formation enzyme)
MSEHFLQTQPWAEFQRTLGREVILKSSDEWSYLAIVENGKFANRLYCPYGPTVTNIDALEDALDDLRAQAEKHNLDFVRVEPRYDEISSVEDNFLTQLGLIKAAHDVQPADTIVNYLNCEDGELQSDEEILAQGSQSMRQVWRKLLKNDVTYVHSSNPDDIQIFLEMIHKVAKRTGMTPLPDNYFEKIGSTLFEDGSAGMFLAKIDNDVIASLIYYKSSDMVIYAHAAANDNYRKLSPGTGLVVELFKFARDNNISLVDLHGVAPENSDKSNKWSGFTHFKKSFGGERKQFCGTWELPVRKFRYRIYRTLLKFLGDR